MTRVWIDDLREGDLCRFVYVLQSGNFRYYQWTSTGVFLGRRGNQVFVSYRPLAGTTELPGDQILEIHRLKPAGERAWTRGDDAVVLPKRKPGAVAAPPRRVHAP